MSDPKRLTDAELDAFVLTEDDIGDAAKRIGPILSELRATRALLRELVETEGCPWRPAADYYDEDAPIVCALCGVEGRFVEASPVRKPVFDHTSDCIWPRLVAEVRG